MPGPCFAKRTKESDTVLSNFAQLTPLAADNESSLKDSGVVNDCYSPILPGLPDHLAEHCLALVPRSTFPVMGAVCHRWRSLLKSKEFLAVRELVGRPEEWIYVLTKTTERQEVYWEALDCLGHQQFQIPLMPGLGKSCYGVVVLNEKIHVIGGYSMVRGTKLVSPHVYQYDTCLNRWSKLASMNAARYDFACAEVNGRMYVTGGRDENEESLTSSEIYNPDTDKWTEIESPRHPRWGSFGFGAHGKLYIMAGRSSFTIGNSKYVDVYNPDEQIWHQMKNGCVMVIAHAVLGDKMCCMEWKDQRTLAIFNPADDSWAKIPIPVEGSSNVGFQFGVLDGKLLLFSSKKVPGYFLCYDTLLYDPNATSGSEWLISNIKPSGSCLQSVTIKV